MQLNILGIFLMLLNGVYGYNGTWLATLIVDNLDRGKECTLFVNSANPNHDNTNDTRSTVFVYGADMDLDTSRAFSLLLKTKAFCVISIIETDDTRLLGMFISMTSVIDNHNMIYVGKNEPHASILSKINRPLIWITPETEKKEPTTIYYYCAKMGKPNMPKLHKITFLTDQFYSGDNRMAIDFRAKCSNPMAGQVITLAGTPVQPVIHLPNTVGNKGLSGFAANLFFFFAKYFKFKPNIKFTGGGTFIPYNRTFTPGAFNDVMSGEADMTVAAVNEILLLFDLGVPLRETNLVYMTRPPRPIKIYDQMQRPFPETVWVVVFTMCAILSILMYFIHQVHTKDIIQENHLVRKEELTLNFFLFPFTKITEPDALPWFEEWSSGKLAYFLWTVFSVFIIFFYTSNLRAHLIYIDYEKTPTGLKDVYERGERVYIYDIAIRQRKEYLQLIGKTDTYKYKVAKLADETGGIYNMIKHRGIHRNAAEDMANNGAFALVDDVMVPFLYLSHPLWRREKIFLVPKVVETYYTNLIFKKFSPGTKLFDKLSQRTVEMGIFKHWTTEHLSFRSLMQVKNPQVGLSSLGQTSFYGSYIFYSAGLTLSLIAFSVEMYFWKRRILLRKKMSRKMSLQYPLLEGFDNWLSSSS